MRRRIVTNMATASKRKSPAKRKSPPGPSRPSAPSSRPFLRFYHSEGLRRKTLSLLDRLERARDPTVHRDALAEVVVELAASGMDYYFMRPLKLAGPGFLLEQSANLGMAGVQQVMASVIRQIVGRMEGPQLLSVCGSIRLLML
jgi:hypothetical protein